MCAETHKAKSKQCRGAYSNAKAATQPQMPKSQRRTNADATTQMSMPKHKLKCRYILKSFRRAHLKKRNQYDVAEMRHKAKIQTKNCNSSLERKKTLAGTTRKSSITAGETALVSLPSKNSWLLMHLKFQRDPIALDGGGGDGLQASAGAPASASKLCRVMSKCNSSTLRPM